MVDRRLVFGDPADAGTRWAMEDADNAAGGGNFVIARDLDGGGVLLQYNPTTGNFEPFAPVDLDGQNILDGSTTVYDAATDTVGDGTTSANHESVNTDKISNGPIYAGNQDGSGLEQRLDSAISAASSGDIIILEDGNYVSRTISSNVELWAPITGISSSATIGGGGWTLSNGATLRGLDITSTVQINGNESRVREVTVRSGAELRVGADQVTVMGVHGAGSVIFESGTARGEIGIVTDPVSVTDNGTNDTL